MLRVVLDTNSPLSGLRSRLGASYRVLRLISEGHVRPLVTTALFLEYEAVLKRPEQLKAHGFSLREVDSLLAALAEPVNVHFLWRPQLQDAKDEMVLEAAVNGNADRLVTHNIRDFKGATDRFGLRLCGPAALLEGDLQ